MHEQGHCPFDQKNPSYPKTNQKDLKFFVGKFRKTVHKINVAVILRNVRKSRIFCSFHCWD